ncbi:sensor histidine kinase [Micromonospora cremea]|uniref:Histidine kinase-, DNA gyrase B-, and HSP90-like ATPase n=1 Tax=Micromonospora cremea TaxID=709881 RepID=A0A1N5W0N0_9ACTN|nr:ATP-binding protein [Micromonospora cremea]SIM78774.1 Histidine kinase-, DNA gyrase B-, and HSP90-like ATPase [Micromonospora cremea]
MTEKPLWWREALAGLGGCLLLTVATSPGYAGGPGPFIATPRRPEYHGEGWLFALIPIVVTVVGLCLLRWWPYLLSVAGLLAAPSVWGQLTSGSYPLVFSLAQSAAYPLAVVGVLACAQSLLSNASPGAGAALVGLATGSRLFGSAMVGPGWLYMDPNRPAWHAAMIAGGLAAIVPAVRGFRRGDPAAAGPPGASPSSWRRWRLVIAGGLAVCLVLPLSLLTTERLAVLLDVTRSAVYRHEMAAIAMTGAVTLVLAVGLAAVAGLWSLGAALAVATVQVAVAAPLILAFTALAAAGPVRWLGALVGAAVGAVAASSRWRIAAAGTLAAGAATAVFIAYAATTGHPEKLAEQQRVVPALLLLVLVTAAGTAVAGAAAPVLAPRGAVPAVLGPLVGVLAAGGLQAVEVTYLRDGLPESSFLNPVFHITTSAVLLLAAGAAISGLGVAHHIAERWAERKRAELIRQEAAAAERDRLARPIHDGVLQVLALVQRQGSQLGATGSQLAKLAGEQEVALRNLLTGGAAPARPDGDMDLRATLTALASPVVEVSTPAEPVVVPSGPAAELTAAVQAALDNVRRHAGPGARAWVLLEDEEGGVRVTVRDDGVGFEPQRLADAARAGRLGVAQSMRGRISDLGGTTTIHSDLQEGTEVEFWVPLGR